jgi:hypothetical protein
MRPDAEIASLREKLARAESTNANLRSDLDAALTALNFFSNRMAKFERSTRVVIDATIAKQERTR